MWRFSARLKSGGGQSFVSGRLSITASATKNSASGEMAEYIMWAC